MSKFLRKYQDFSGGLSEVANDNMQDNELVEAVNIVPGDGYGIARCKGTSIAFPQVLAGYKVKRVLEVPVKITQDNATTVKETQTLAFVYADYQEERVFKLSSDKNSWTEITYATEAKASDNSIWAVTSCFIYSYKLYCTNGKGMWIWDGSTMTMASVASTDGSSPTGWENFSDRVKASVFACRRGTRWFYATLDNEVIFSEVGNPLTFNKSMTSILNVYTDNDDSITALHNFNENLLIFKKHTVHCLSGWDLAGGTDIKLTQLNVTSGTNFAQTICTIENAILYLGSNGVYKLYVPYLSSLIAAKNVSEKQISKRLTEGKLLCARATVYNNIYYLSIDKEVKNQTVNQEYRYYMEQKAYYGEYTQGVYGYAPALGDGDHLYIGSDNGYILYYDDSSDHYINTNDGQNMPISIRAKTKGFDVVGNTFQDAKVKKALFSVKQYTTKSTELYIQIKADYAEDALKTQVDSIQDVIESAVPDYEISFDDSLVYDEGQWAGVDSNGKKVAFDWGWIDTVTKQTTVGRKCKRLQFTFRGEKAQPLLIYGIGLLYKRKKVKGNTRNVRTAEIVYPDE